MKKKVIRILNRCIVKDEDDEVVLAEKGNQPLALFGEEIGALTEKIRRVLAHHEKVYHFIYRNIAADQKSR